MTRVIVLCPYPKGIAPSQRFRIEAFINKLEPKDGLQFMTKSFWTNAAFKLLYTKGNSGRKAFYLILGYLRRAIHLLQCISADFVLIHREAAPLGPAILEWKIAKLLGKKIIFDFDDAIWLPNTSWNNRLAEKFKWHSKFYSICANSYKIVAGNEYLKNEALKNNDNVSLIPTVVDTDIYKPIKNDNQTITIGWTGSHSTIKYLNFIIPILRELEKDIDFRFLVISDVKPEFELKSMEFRKWENLSEIEDLSEIDIGIMPLPDNNWTRGKCGFKLIQYLALGIPALAHSVPPNDKIILNGLNGFICQSKKEWKSKLLALIKSKDLRKEFGENGRQHIENNYSLNSQFENFKSLFS